MTESEGETPPSTPSAEEAKKEKKKKKKEKRLKLAEAEAEDTGPEAQVSASVTLTVQQEETLKRLHRGLSAFFNSVRVTRVFIMASSCRLWRAQRKRRRRRNKRKVTQSKESQVNGWRDPAHVNPECRWLWEFCMQAEHNVIL